MPHSNVILSFCRMRCPRCRKGEVFVQKSILPLGTSLRMVERCRVCDMKMTVESNNGPGINYALTMILFFLNLLWYWPIFGLSVTDDSVEYFLITSIAVVVLVQPWLMRYSRMFFLYFVVKYDKRYQNAGQ